VKSIHEFQPFETALAQNGAAVSMFGTTQQSSTRILLVPQPMMNQPSANVNPIGVTWTATPQNGYKVGYFSIYCSADVTAGFVGMGVKIANRYWKMGQWTNASTTFTDDTADAQNATANDVALETLTANDGFLIACATPFNAISANITTASGGTAPARAVDYSIATGWSSAALMPVTNAAALATGEAVWAWHAWPDWVPMTAVHGTNVPLGYYGVRFRSTTAPGATAALAQAIEVCRLFWLTGACAPNSTLSQDFGAKGFNFPGEGDGLVGYIQTPGTSKIPSRFTGLWAHGW
jgi:hypothetical protein